MMERWGITRRRVRRSAAERIPPTSRSTRGSPSASRPSRRRSGKRVAARRANGESRSPGRRRGRAVGTPLMGSMIEFTPPDGKTAPGYLAQARIADATRPASCCSRSGGELDDRIKATADRLASHGFNVLVPDLFRGRSAATGDEANHLDGGPGLRRRRDARRRRRGAVFARSRRAARRRHRLLHGRRIGDAVRDARRRSSMRPASGTDTRRRGRRSRQTSAFRFRGTGRSRTSSSRSKVSTRSRPSSRPPALAYEFHRYDAKHGFYNTGELGEGGLGHYIANTPKPRGAARSSSSTARCAT